MECHFDPLDPDGLNPLGEDREIKYGTDNCISEPMSGYDCKGSGEPDWDFECWVPWCGEDDWWFQEYGYGPMQDCIDLCESYGSACAQWHSETRSCSCAQSGYGLKHSGPFCLVKIESLV